VKKFQLSHKNFPFLRPSMIFGTLMCVVDLLRASPLPSGLLTSSMPAVLKLFAQEFPVDGSEEVYKINPRGPLSPLFGELFSELEYAKNKLCLSYGIETEYQCQNDKCKRCRGKTGKFRALKRKPYLFTDENSSLSPKEREYIFDYHTCLTSMFMCRDKRVEIETTDTSSFYYFLNNKCGRDAPQLLALLFLLPEELGNSEFRCEVGKNELIFEARRWKVEVPLPSHDFMSRPVSDNAIRQIVSFLGKCGADDAYREIIERKIHDGIGSKNNSIYLVETPQFLMQAYVHEYFSRKNFRNYEIFFRCVFRVLYGLRGESANKIFHEYFITKGEFENIDLGVFSDYGDLIGALGERDRLFPPFFSCASSFKEISTNFYDRKNRKYLKRMFSNTTEAIILSALSFLFYDKSTECFDLSHLKTVRNSRYRALVKFFGTYRCPEDLYRNKAEAMKRFNMLVQDLPDSNVVYLEKESAVRNRLYGSIPNIVYVMAYLTGNDKLTELVSYNPERLFDYEKGEEKFQQFFEKLACKKSDFTRVICTEDRHYFRTLLLCTKCENYILRITNFETETKINYENLTLPDSKELIKAFKKKLRTSNSWLTDLLRKTIDFKIKPHFATDLHPHIRGKRNKKIVEQFTKMINGFAGNPDHLILFYDTIKVYLPNVHAPYYQEALYLLDTLRPFALEEEFGRRTELCRFMANAVFFMSQKMGCEERQSFFFLMLYGIEDAAVLELFECGRIKEYLSYLDGGNCKKYHFNYNGFDAEHIPCIENLSIYLLENVYNDTIAAELDNLVRQKFYRPGFQDIDDEGVGAVGPSEPSEHACSPFFEQIVAFTIRHNVFEGLEILHDDYPEDLGLLVGLHRLCIMYQGSFSELFYVATTFLAIAQEGNGCCVDSEFCNFFELKKNRPHWEYINRLCLNQMIVEWSSGHAETIDVVWKMYDYIVNQLNPRNVTLYRVTKYKQDFRLSRDIVESKRFYDTFELQDGDDVLPVQAKHYSYSSKKRTSLMRRKAKSIRGAQAGSLQDSIIVRRRNPYDSVIRWIRNRLVIH